MSRPPPHSFSTIQRLVDFAVFGTKQRLNAAEKEHKRGQAYFTKVKEYANTIEEAEYLYEHLDEKQLDELSPLYDKPEDLIIALKAYKGADALLNELKQKKDAEEKAEKIKTYRAKLTGERLRWLLDQGVAKLVLNDVYQSDKDKENGYWSREFKVLFGGESKADWVVHVHYKSKDSKEAEWVHIKSWADRKKKEESITLNVKPVYKIVEACNAVW